MKIGIIFYSLTGNTLSVADKLQSELTASGHEVSVERISILGGPRQDLNPKIDRVPDPQPHDALVFAAPVRGFALDPAMRACLEQMPELSGKGVVCLITHYLPFAWMGGRQAASQMKKLSEDKSGHVIGSGIINWSRKDRDRQISQTVGRLSKLLAQTANSHL
jgi:flavodoxin